jgi:hypothetical protein
VTATGGLFERVGPKNPWIADPMGELEGIGDSERENDTPNGRTLYDEFS